MKILDSGSLSPQKFNLVFEPEKAFHLIEHSRSLCSPHGPGL